MDAIVADQSLLSKNNMNAQFNSVHIVVVENYIPLS